MPESYTPRQFIDKVNSDNPGGVKYDPYGTDALRRRVQEKAEGGSIFAEAQKVIDSRTSPPEAARQKQFEKIEEIMSEEDMQPYPQDYIFENIINNLDEFPDVNQTEITDILINRLKDKEINFGKEIAENIRYFEPKYHRKIALQIIDSIKKGLDFDASVSEGLELYLGNFSGLDNSVAEALLETEHDKGIVADHLDKFPGLDHKKLAEILLDDEEHGYSLIKNYDKFSGLDDSEMFDRLFDKGNELMLINNKEKFKSVTDDYIADKLIKSGKIYYLSDNYEKFSGLDEKISDEVMTYRHMQDKSTSWEEFNKTHGTNPEDIWLRDQNTD